MSVAARLKVKGVVQGVGFRPFVHRLARDAGLTGWVANTSDGAVVHVEGSEAAVASLPGRLRAEAPAVAVIETIEVSDVAPEGLGTFEIRESLPGEGEMTLVAPDIATCPECVRELLDRDDRRHRYPFINCTNCGPRFTIIDDIPYDRPATTMRDFPMCRVCAAEYADPGDRRFHAQPDACFTCGPRLYLNVRGRAPSGWDWDRLTDTVPRRHRDAAAELRRSDDIIAAAAQMLAGGEILAVKGLGGFHLVCDATDEEAVARLRERKRRWAKPFAVMFPSLDDAAAHCEISEEEAALLTGPVRPIVLLRSRASAPARALAPSIAPGLTEVGVMLPYTPLHHLLLGAVRGPLVMTSGNLSDEPIATENTEALRRLAPLADGFLLHDRAIRSRYDDSVVRVAAGRVEPVRRARGYAPFPLTAPVESDRVILATGPEQKNTFCLLRGSRAFISQHIGDMENAETLESFEETLALYGRLFRAEPELVGYDLHPEYLTTKHALSMGLPAIGVQHHHAHVVSVMAENGVTGPVVGLAFDGTGYGPDGTIWGGEVLVATWSGFERAAHLLPVPLPGGAAAIRRPARMAFSLLNATDVGLLDAPGVRYLRDTLTTDELTTLPAMISRGVNSPLTSSMGRLFDAVAALCGIRADAAYEGQAAIELEAVADESETGSYRFDVIAGPPAIVDPRPVVRSIVDDLAAGVGAPVVSARFHAAVAEVSVRVAAETAKAAGTRRVALAGGVFMNVRLLTAVVRGLEAEGLDVLLPRELPINDGGISYGQALVAWSRRHEV